MVDRTNIYGEVVDEDECDGYVVNTAPIGQPLLLIFWQNNRELIKRLEGLPKVFYCESKKIKTFSRFSHHIIVFENDADKIGRFLLEATQRLMAIDLTGEYRGVKLSDSIFRLDFGGKSDDFVYDYLKEILR